LDAKRTWRGAREKGPEEREKDEWTAMGVLEAYAEEKGWVTAKAGRPDVGRAGNSIMRALAEARIPWGFLPPDADMGGVKKGDGIWLGAEGGEPEEGTDRESTVYASDSEHGESEEEDVEGEGEENGDEEEDEEDRANVEEVKSAMRGMRLGRGFAALAQDEDEDEEEGENEENKSDNES